MVLPMPQQIIPVMTETPSTLQVWSRNEQNRNTSLILPDNQIPVLPLDSDSHTSSSSSTHTNTLEIIHRTSPSDPDKEPSEDASTKLLGDALKAFLSDTGNLDNHNNALDQKCLLQVAGSTASQTSNTKHDASNTGDKILSVPNSQTSAVTTGNGSHQCFTRMETLESDLVKVSQGIDSSYISEVLRFKDPEKAHISSEPHIFQESDSIWAQRRPGNVEAPHDRHTCRENSFSGDKLMLSTKPWETAQAEDAIKPLNSQATEQWASSAVSLDTEMKVKWDTCQVVKDTLTFTGISNEACKDGRDSLEKQHIDESREAKKKKGYVREGTENGSQMISCSEYFREDLVVLESKLQDDNEKPFQRKDTEIRISSRTSLVCEPHKQTECLNKGEEEAVCYELQGEERIANRECENGLKNEDQVKYRKRECDECKELNKELHRLQSSPEASSYTPNLCITSHTSSPSGLFTWTESVSEGDGLHVSVPNKGFISEETLRCRVAQDVQDIGVGTEFPSSYTRTASPSVGRMSSWLLVCWAKISTLSYITGPLVCAILFVIFVTAYLHDLPVCLAIYLLSACWWCRHGMKKQVTTAESVD